MLMNSRVRSGLRTAVEVTVIEVKSGKITTDLAANRLYQSGIPVAAIARILTEATPPDNYAQPDPSNTLPSPLM
jgi:hypothetical protein